MSDLGSDGADLGSGLSIPSLPSVSTPSGRSGHGVFGGGGAKGADAPPLTGKRTMAGWLHKEGKRLRGRTRRYLIATDEVLAQAPKEGASPSWTVARDDAHVYPGERPLELVVATPRRTVSYFAEDTAELVRWLRALRNSQSLLSDFYVVERQIGKGSYGEVFLGHDIITHEPCAIKVIKKNPFNRKQKKFIERESAIMKTVDNAYIVQTLDVFESHGADGSLTIVSEYCGGGELFDLIIASQCFTEDKARHIMRQVLLGVDYLHSRGIVHRDIKPENILACSTTWPLNVKLTDFGLSNFIDGDSNCQDNALLSHVGTSYYISPEILGKKGYGPPVDLWASGVVLYIMLCGRFPFFGKTDVEYVQSLHRGANMTGPDWDSVSDTGKAFLCSLLSLDPKRRLTAKEALDHDWMLEGLDGLQKNLSSPALLGSVDHAAPATADGGDQTVAPVAVVGRRTAGGGRRPPVGAAVGVPRAAAAGAAAGASGAGGARVPAAAGGAGGGAKGAPAALSPTAVAAGAMTDASGRPLG